jgi:hypothetical protein
LNWKRSEQLESCRSSQGDNHNDAQGMGIFSTAIDLGEKACVLKENAAKGILTAPEQVDRG